LVQEFACSGRDHDCQIPIAQDHQDYFVDLGYVTDRGQWLSLASSAPVQVPACERNTAAIPLGMAGAGIAVAGATIAAAGAARHTDRDHQRSQVSESRLIFVPRNHNSAYAYWEIPRAQLQQCPAGEKLRLRLYNVTESAIHDPLPKHYQETECAVSDHDCDLRLPVDGRDYIAELGYNNAQGQWVSLARSERTHVAAGQSSTPTHQGETAALMDRIAQPHQPPIGNDTHHGLVDRAVSGEDQGRLVIMSQIPQRITVGAALDDEPQAYVYWDIPESRKQAMPQGSRQMVLRVYDATEINLDRQPAHSFRQYPISDHDRDLVVSVPRGDRDYVAEIGYLAPGGKLISLLRSTHTRVPVGQHH
jgi:phosphate transport system substrate-binding protein